MVDKRKYRINRQLEETMKNAFSDLDKLQRSELQVKDTKKVDQSNEQYVYRLLEHLDPKVFTYTH